MLIRLYDLLINTRYFNVYIDKHDDNCLKSLSAYSSSKSSPESSNSVSIVSTTKKKEKFRITSMCQITGNDLKLQINFY